MRRNAKCRTQRGFSLIELAVVLLILSILLSLGLGAINSQITKSNYETTFRHRDNIKDALITYLRVNQRLPCPSNVALDGAEAINGPGTACNPNVVAGRTNFGILPWRTLGLERKTALDGWDTYFSYMVSDGAGTDDWIATTGIRATSTGALVRRENNLTPPPATLDTGGYAVALISHGPNALGGFTAKLFPNVNPASVEEQVNEASTANTFFAGEPTPNFDDITLGLTADELTGRLIADGVFDDPIGETSRRVSDQMNELLGQLVGSRNRSDTTSPGCDAVNPCSEYTIPACPTPPPPLVEDSWANDLQCFSAGGSLDQTPPAGVALKVWSNGEDGLLDNAGDCLNPDDDICVSYTYNELVGLLTGQNGFR